MEFGRSALAPDERSGETGRYAVVFRTHFWDAFVGRQFERLLEVVGQGDVYVLVDETRGHVAGIPTQRCFRLTDGQVLAAGYVAAGEGSIQWFSGDVPLYMFRAAHPDYDYYVQLEYDVNIHRPVDDIVDQVARDRADIVSLERRETPPDWYWMPTLAGVYPVEEATHRLICLSIFSGRALDALSAARLCYAERYRAGELPSWPFCEAFIPIEGKRLGLRLSDLSSYGDVDRYDWWPPYLEKDLPSLRRHAFVHPILDRPRFTASMLKYPNVRALFGPRSDFHRRLRRLGMAGYLKVILSRTFLTQAGQTLKARMKQRSRAT